MYFIIHLLLVYILILCKKCSYFVISVELRITEIESRLGIADKSPIYLDFKSITV